MWSIKVAPDIALHRAGSSTASPGRVPIFTAELKNPLTGQDVEDAIRQYKTDRDPREPLLAYGRCLTHFAVDPDLVYDTTHLQGAKTRFLPFNQGKFGGAGNPPVPPTRQGYATAYLWEETWARDSAQDLVRQFIHEVEEEDERGRKTGRRFLIFPRYQQLDCVRRLVADARSRGAGHRYLIQQLSPVSRSPFDQIEVLGQEGDNPNGLAYVGRAPRPLLVDLDTPPALHCHLYLDQVPAPHPDHSGANHCHVRAFPYKGRRRCLPERGELCQIGHTLKQIRLSCPIGPDQEVHPRIWLPLQCLIGAEVDE